MYSTLNDLLKRHHSPLFDGPLAAQVHQQLELLRAGVGGPRFRTIGGASTFDEKKLITQQVTSLKTWECVS